MPTQIAYCGSCPGACYAMPSAGIPNAVISLSDARHIAAAAISLRACYAMPGTDVPYACSGSAGPSTEREVAPAEDTLAEETGVYHFPIVLCRPCVLSGTVLAYLYYHVIGLCHRYAEYWTCGTTRQYVTCRTVRGTRRVASVLFQALALVCFARTAGRSWQNDPNRHTTGSLDVMHISYDALVPNE
eukprot:3329070-Rhodomonas_salina.1